MSTIHTLASGTGSEWTCDPRWASEGFETFAGTIREELLSVLWDGEAAKPQPKVGHPGGSCLGRHQPGQQRQLYAVIEKPALSVQSNVQGRGRAADARSDARRAGYQSGLQNVECQQQPRGTLHTIRDVTILRKDFKNRTQKLTS